MQAYSVLLISRGISYSSRLDESALAFPVNGVKIEVELDGSLSIENPLDYHKQQLQFLSLREQDRCDAWFLTDFVFRYALPVKLLDRDEHRVIDTVMEGSIADCGTTAYTWSIRDARSSAPSLDSALAELQQGLSPGFTWMACWCCQYGQEHPYGGDVYLNFLCFRKSKRAYARLGEVGKADWEFFCDTNHTQRTRPLYCCEDFSPRRRRGESSYANGS